MRTFPTIVRTSLIAATAQKPITITGATFPKNVPVDAFGSPKRSTMFRAIVVNVVNRQQVRVIDPAAVAAPPVGGDHTGPEIGIVIPGPSANLHIVPGLVPCG